MLIERHAGRLSDSKKHSPPIRPLLSDLSRSSRAVNSSERLRHEQSELRPSKVAVMVRFDQVLTPILDKIGRLCVAHPPCAHSRDTGA